MKKITKIGILSLGKIMGFLYFLFGFIFGAVVTFISLLVLVIFQTEDNIGSLIGLWAIILLPVFYGIMGFLIGLLTAWLYNLAARFIGGLEVEIE